MKHSDFPVLVIALFLGVVMQPMILTAQEKPAPDPLGHEVVAYRLVEWKEMHFDDPANATVHMRTVQKLGCEAWQEHHGGHVDIVYRCSEWRKAAASSQQDAIEKREWLIRAGFDTHRAAVHPRFRRGSQVIEVRLTEWKVAHLTGDSGDGSKDLTSQLKDLGCETKVDPHGKHVDLKYRCPVWTSVRLSNGKAAEQLQVQLREFGFETKPGDAAAEPSSP